MIKLSEVKKFLDKCETEEELTSIVNGDILEIYRFDGFALDDNILIAKVDKEFNVTLPDGSIAPFNDGDGLIDDIESATAKDITIAILSNIKTVIAINVSIDVSHIKWIDKIFEKNEIPVLEVETFNGQKY